ncbi:MAG: hypothetical protein JXR48_04090 [Candidatus Delongbacteria bacterium]|nr:hypothetical protein [Candidatus Delongbacteria bacterium]MBN2834126.1 hypothetical protein [Candidatus Delongbacteria bacterium]
MGFNFFLLGFISAHKSLSSKKPIYKSKRFFTTLLLFLAYICAAFAFKGSDKFVLMSGYSRYIFLSIAGTFSFLYPNAIKFFKYEFKQSFYISRFTSEFAVFSSGYLTYYLFFSSLLSITFSLSIILITNVNDFLIFSDYILLFVAQLMFNIEFILIILIKAFTDLSKHINFNYLEAKMLIAGYLVLAFSVIGFNMVMNSTFTNRFIDNEYNNKIFIIVYFAIHLFTIIITTIIMNKRFVKMSHVADILSLRRI